MYSTVRTAVLDGISAIPVQVEVDISTGMPVFDMVGNLTSEVREEMCIRDRPYVIRQNNPTEGTTTFEDEIYGDITVDNAEQMCIRDRYVMFI